MLAGMERQVATTRILGMLCMGMTLATATGVLALVNWILAGGDLESLRTSSIQPLAMFAVGVGVRALGSTLIRGVRLRDVVLGDVVATLIGVLVFVGVAAMRDPAGIVGLATIIIVVALLPLAALVSLVATAMSKSRLFLMVSGVVSGGILIVTVALQGTLYWPSS